MKRIRFKGEPGTALKNEYDNGTVRFYAIGEEQDLPDDVADVLLADFPKAFEVVARTKSEDDEFGGRDTKPERNRMRTSAPRKRGKAK